MAENIDAERAAPDVYENGPEGMPRVKRMPSAVLDCIIQHSLFRYLGDALEGEDRDRLYGLMHDTANEALARIDGWPASASIGEDELREPSRNFNDWWNADRLTKTNPFREDSPAYWAWEGWTAALTSIGEDAWIAACSAPYESIGEANSVEFDGIGEGRLQQAAQDVKTWQEHAKADGWDQPATMRASTKTHYMEYELADLRAQLARQSHGAFDNIRIGQEFLNWNRAQGKPPVAIGKELGIVRKVLDLAAPPLSSEQQPRLVAALNKIIEMNRDTAEAQYGDANKAESWACVRVAREALAGEQKAEKGEKP
jgi:hypothetical protein